MWNTVAVWGNIYKYESPNRYLSSIGLWANYLGCVYLFPTYLHSFISTAIIHEKPCRIQLLIPNCTYILYDNAWYWYLILHWLLCQRIISVFTVVLVLTLVWENVQNTFAYSISNSPCKGIKNVITVATVWIYRVDVLQK